MPKEQSFDCCSFHRDEEVDLIEDSQYLMRYNVVKDLLSSGAVVFI